LGWSGDTVFGDARAGFDTPAKGFERLVSLTLELKPTVIFVSYGTNESFEGEVGLPKFEKGLEKLLDALAPAKARVVLFTPLPFETHVHRPDPRVRNKTLAAYSNSIARIAEARAHSFADLNSTIGEYYDLADRVYRAEPGSGPSEPLTDNGMHL